jgi:hypothetical protein
MKSKLVMAAVAAALGLPAAGHAAMTKAQYNAEKERIGAEYDTAREKCNVFGGNAKDICLAQAKGNNLVARAELDERNEPSPKARYNVGIVKAEAEYNVARERCDERLGAAKDACLAEAKAALARDKANATQDQQGAISRRP